MTGVAPLMGAVISQDNQIERISDFEILRSTLIPAEQQYNRLSTSFSYTSYGGGFAALWRHRDRSSQEYLTPGCQVLGGYEKLGTLPDMISSPGSHFAVLDHVMII
jgi:hypothetical protein